MRTRVFEIRVNEAVDLVGGELDQAVFRGGRHDQLVLRAV